MALSERLAFLLTANGTQAISEFNKVGTAAGRSLGTAEAATARTKASLTRLGVGFVTMGGLAAFGLYQAAQAASAQEEAQNKVNEVFGDSAGIVKDFAETSARSFGISETAALDGAGAIGNMLTAMGTADDQAAAMSVSMVELAADMASFNDQDPTEMLGRIQSGLSGEMEPLKRYGAVLSETRVKQHAWTTGMVESGEALTEQDKLMARYSLLLEDTLTQQGDFARTSDSLAQQQRVLSATFQDLIADIGQGALPVFSKLVGGLAEVVTVIGELDAVTGGALGAFGTYGAAASLAVGGVMLLVGATLKIKAAMGAAQIAITNGIIALRTLAFAHPVMAGVAIAAVGVFAAYRTLTGGSDELAEKTEALNEAFTAQGGEFGVASRQMIAGMIGSSDAASTFAEDMEAAGVSIHDIETAAAQGPDALRELMDSFTGASGTIDLTGASAHGAGSAYSDLRDEILELALAWNDADPEAVAAVLGETEDAAVTAAQAIDTLMTEIDEYISGIQSIPEAQDALSSSFNDLIETVAENGPVWEGNSRKALENRDALREVVSTHAEVISRMVENGRGQGAMQQRTRATIDGLRGLRDTGVITAEMFRTLKRDILNVPGTVPVRVSTNVQTALDEVDRLLQRLDNLNGRSVSFNVAGNYSGAGALRAHGGFIREGESSLVHAGESVSVRGGIATVTPRASNDSGGGTVDLSQRSIRALAKELMVYG